MDLRFYLLEKAKVRQRVDVANAVLVGDGHISAAVAQFDALHLAKHIFRPFESEAKVTYVVATFYVGEVAGQFGVKGGQVVNVGVKVIGGNARQVTQEKLGEMHVEHDPLVHSLAQQLANVVEEVEGVLVHLAAVRRIQSVTLFRHAEQIELRVEDFLYRLLQEF